MVLSDHLVPLKKQKTIVVGFFQMTHLEEITPRQDSSTNALIFNDWKWQHPFWRKSRFVCTMGIDFFSCRGEMTTSQRNQYVFTLKKKKQEWRSEVQRLLHYTLDSHLFHTIRRRDKSHCVCRRAARQASQDRWDLAFLHKQEIKTRRSRWLLSSSDVSSIIHEHHTAESDDFDFVSTWTDCFLSLCLSVHQAFSGFCPSWADGDSVSVCDHVVVCFYIWQHLPGGDLVDANELRYCCYASFFSLSKTKRTWTCLHHNQFLLPWFPFRFMIWVQPVPSPLLTKSVSFFWLCNHVQRELFSLFIYPGMFTIFPIYHDAWNTISSWTHLTHIIVNTLAA